MTRARLIQRTPAADEALWLDHPDAEELICQRTRELDLARPAQELIRTGITRLEGAVDGALCDRLMADFRSFCRNSPEAPAFADSYGYHSRLLNFHLRSDAALRIGLNARVLRLLDFLFGYRTAVYASLTFERGTEQAFHRDSPFFHTQPSGFFFGVWTALEDVHPDAGPLEYYPGGHRVHVDHRSIGARLRDHPQRRDQMFTEYIAAVKSACDVAGLKRERILLRKGDVLIWHPALPHSGSRITDRSRSRKSIVFHYIPEGVRTYQLDHFFDPSGRYGKPAPLRYVSRYGRLYYRHAPPSFQPNL